MAALAEGTLPERIEGAEHAHRVETVDATVSSIRARTSFVPSVAIILGTGLGALGAAITVENVVEYADIPGFPVSTVESHSGKLIFGTLGGKRVGGMPGRCHRFEG